MADELTPIIARIQRHIRIDGTCWLWTGTLNNGRGTIRINGHRIRADRLIWQLTHGPIAPRLELWRHCPHPACVNPRHHRLHHPRENYTNRTPCNSLTSVVP